MPATTSSSLDGRTRRTRWWRPMRQARARAQELDSTAVRGVAALFVTPKTVEYHPARVYRKVSVRSRAELVLAFSRTGSPPA